MMTGHENVMTGRENTVTIGGDLTVGNIGYGAMQLTGPKVWGDYPDHDGRRSRCCAGSSTKA